MSCSRRLRQSLTPPRMAASTGIRIAPGLRKAKRSERFITSTDTRPV